MLCSSAEIGSGAALGVSLIQVSQSDYVMFVVGRGDGGGEDEKQIGTLKFPHRSFIDLPDQTLSLLDGYPVPRSMRTRHGSPM